MSWTLLESLRKSTWDSPFAFNVGDEVELKEPHRRGYTKGSVFIVGLVRLVHQNSRANGIIKTVSYDIYLKGYPGALNRDIHESYLMPHPHAEQGAITLNNAEVHSKTLHYNGRSAVPEVLEELRRLVGAKSVRALRVDDVTDCRYDTTRLNVNVDNKNKITGCHLG